MAVVVILAILAAIAVPAILTIIDHTKKQAYVGDAYAIRDATNYYLKELLVNEKVSPEQVTYSSLLAHDYIEEIIDPDTNQYWDKTNTSFVVIEEGRVVSVCIKGIERQLCGANNKPLPINNLSPDDVVSY